ncbi:MAG: hypothetical protein R2759_19600 [Bacteroidales bacterium]
MRYYNGSSWSECMGNIVSTATWDCGENIIDSRRIGEAIQRFR